MNIEISSTATEARAVLTGRFDAHETEAFREAIEPYVDHGEQSFAVDLAMVNFVDSSALAELVRAMKHCAERDKNFVIENPSNPVAVILELTGLDKAFSIASYQA